jgi:endoribonuclease Dicer
METAVPDIVPRAYQEEIFERARQGNIIAAIDTGAGKTYIAVLLARWMAAQPENYGKKVALYSIE